MSQSNLPATRPKAELAAQEATLAQLVKQYEGNIRNALPEHVKPERMLSIIRTAITSNPGLKDCSPLSVIASIVAASRLGLECDGALGQAYLVPRWSKNTRRMEACLQIGYMGKLDLTYRTDKVLGVQVRLVHEKDEFSLVYEPEPKLLHRPAVGDRGALLAAYVYIKYKDGQMDIFEPLSVAEACKVRDNYAPRERCRSCWGKRGVRENCKDCDGTGQGKEIVGPWKDHFEEMVRKTALHRAWKWMPKSVELADAMRMENRMESGESPETIVLDIPAEEVENAMVQAGTEIKKDSLKERLSQQRAGQAPPATQDTPTTTAGRAQGQTADPIATTAGTEREIPDSAIDGAKAGKGETGIAPGTNVKSPIPPTVREVDELPDPLEVEDDRLYYRGELWVRNGDNTAWSKVEKAAPVRAKPAATRPARAGRDGSAFDFDGGKP